ARIVPVPAGAGAAGRDELSSVYVLVDTSASRALGLADEIGALSRLLGELRKAGADPQVTVAAFDQDAAAIASGKASAIDAQGAMSKRLVERRALGASDLGRALDFAAAALKKDRHGRVLLVTDGVATAGDTAADHLRARVKALGAAGVQRLDVLAVGGIREDGLLARLVTAGLAHDGMVLDGARPAAELARR